MSSTVYTEDLDRFWSAFDEIQQEPDKQEHLKILESTYLNRGSKGLGAFARLRNCTVGGWLDMISRYPRYLQLIRAKADRLKQDNSVLNGHLSHFSSLYPWFSPVNFWFVIGGFNSGGTVVGSHILIGSEITLGDKTMDLSEISDPWFKHRCLSREKDDFIFTCIHESVHTQQVTISQQMDLLGSSIREGSADFIAELVTGSLPSYEYMNYGFANHKTVREKFIQQMHSYSCTDWLYNGHNTQGTVADLGYFMGYIICKHFFENSGHAEKAIAEIIRLDYNDHQAVTDFAERSGYFSSPLNTLITHDLPHSSSCSGVHKNG